MIVDIPPTAMELIRQYQNTDCNSPYLFPILSGTKTGEELYIEYQQALRIMNYNLGRLARRCGVITKVSSYTTRHTWATLAKYCNFSEQLICEAFGHSSVKVTETYLKNFKYEEIKKANDAIILYVSKNGKKRVWIDKKLIIKLFKFRYFVSNRIYSAAKIDNKSIANKKQPASFF